MWGPTSREAIWTDCKRKQCRRGWREPPLEEKGEDRKWGARVGTVGSLKAKNSTTTTTPHAFAHP